MSALGVELEALGPRTPGTVGLLRASGIVAERLHAAGAIAEGPLGHLVWDRVTAVTEGAGTWLKGPGGNVDAARFRVLAVSAQGAFEGPLVRWSAGISGSFTGAVVRWDPAATDDVDAMIRRLVGEGAVALLIAEQAEEPLGDPLPALREGGILPVFAVDADVLDGLGSFAAERMAGAVELSLASVAVANVAGVLPGRGALQHESVVLIGSLVDDSSSAAALVCTVEALARRRVATSNRRVVALALAGSGEDDGPASAFTRTPELATGVVAVVEVDAVRSGQVGVVGVEQSDAFAHALLVAERVAPVRVLPDAAHLVTHRRSFEAVDIPALQVVAAGSGSSPGTAVRWLEAAVADIRVSQRPTVALAAPVRARPPVRLPATWFGWTPDPRATAWMSAGSTLRDVATDGPAWSAGLRVGDRVLAIDGLPIENGLVPSSPDGRAVEVQFVRGDAVKSAVVVPGTRPGFEGGLPRAGEAVPHLREGRETGLLDLRRVTVDGHNAEVAWEESGGSLLLTRRPEGEACPSVWRLSLGTGALVRLSTQGVRGPVARSPSWLGTSFTCPGSELPADADVMAFTDGVGAPIVAGPGYDGEADVCGAVIVLTSDRGGDPDLYVGSLGGDVVRVAGGPGWDGGARFLRGCSGLVWRRALAPYGAGPSELWTSAIDGSGAAALTDWGAITYSPFPLRNGRVLATSDLGVDGSFDLWIAERGAEPERLTWWRGFDGEGVVSPDGAWLAFTSDRGDPSGTRRDVFLARWGHEDSGAHVR